MSIKVEKCVVPNCDNPTTKGIPFPEESKQQEKWLESLQITNFTPTKTSFVCLDHFPNAGIEPLENILADPPIPVLTTFPIKCKQEPKENVPTCRLCMNEHAAPIRIFSNFNSDEKITIATAIIECIPALKISKNDTLSKVICPQCLASIQQYHNFRTMCVKNFTKQELTQKRPLTETIPTQNEAKKAKIMPVEAELIKVLQGTLPEEMRSAENIIIEVRSDDEGEEILPLQTTSEKIVEKLNLPKGIQVKSTKASNVPGNFQAKIIRNINNSVFCLINNYIFEYGLIKGNLKYLKCLTTKCKAVAHQIIGDNKITVKVGHNHPAPSECERKKLMFFSIIRKKMQSDRNLNFRIVYEEMCQKDPEIRKLVPLITLINQVCCQPNANKIPQITSFEHFYNIIEDDICQELHYTHANRQFYQDRFTIENGTKAVVFAVRETIENLSDSKLMCVDASFRIETKENFDFHLVTALVWFRNSYFPIMYALVDNRNREIYKALFEYLRYNLAPNLHPEEIVTDYEANLYYTIGEVYSESHIGGSVYYYTQNLYKKICALNLSRELETNSCFRTIYHMILMLPLLPVNTIADGLSNIESQAVEMGQYEMTKPLFEYFQTEWMEKITPDLFCVHRLENRINENVIAPFKKLRDFLLLSKGKLQKQHTTIITVVEKIIEVEGFLQVTYSAPFKKSFTRDVSTMQKKTVIRAWQFIENHPKININVFFTKILGYIKCMENQLWIWGYYRFEGEHTEDELINAANFSIITTSNDNNEDEESVEHVEHNYQSQYLDYVYQPDGEVVMDIVINENTAELVEENGKNQIIIKQE